MMTLDERIAREEWEAKHSQNQIDAERAYETAMGLRNLRFQYEMAVAEYISSHHDSVK